MITLFLQVTTGVLANFSLTTFSRSLMFFLSLLAWIWLLVLAAQEQVFWHTPSYFCWEALYTGPVSRFYSLLQGFQAHLLKNNPIAAEHYTPASVFDCWNRVFEVENVTCLSPNKPSMPEMTITLIPKNLDLHPGQLFQNLDELLCACFGKVESSLAGIHKGPPCAMFAAVSAILFL